MRVSEREGGDGRSAAAGGGYRTKNKNPTRQCGEKHSRKTSAIYHVCQTCQGDGKAETEWSEASMSNLPGRREHAACRPKMPGKTCQADVKTCHLKAKNAS